MLKKLQSEINKDVAELLHGLADKLESEEFVFVGNDPYYTCSVGGGPYNIEDAVHDISMRFIEKGAVKQNDDDDGVIYRGKRVSDYKWVRGYLLKTEVLAYIITRPDFKERHESLSYSADIEINGLNAYAVHWDTVVKEEEMV